MGNPTSFGFYSYKEILMSNKVCVEEEQEFTFRVTYGATLNNNNINYWSFVQFI